MDQNQQPVLAAIAKELQLPIENVQTAVELLDAGNTIPFIARFRKDKTGNLDARQLRDIRHRLTHRRGLIERKNYILKSIESQGKLTDEFKSQIENVSTSKELEDLFLPYKPKKQSLATVAKQKGLEPLARDILEGVSPEIDLATRSTDFVRVDKDLNSIDEVIDGVSHIVAERFSENVQLRSRLRSIIWDSGKIATSKIETEPKSSASLPQKTPAQPDPVPPTDSATPAADENSATTQPPAAEADAESVSTVSEGSADPDHSTTDPTTSDAASNSTNDAVAQPDVQPQTSSSVEADPEVAAATDDATVSQPETLEPTSQQPVETADQTPDGATTVEDVANDAASASAAAKETGTGKPDSGAKPKSKKAPKKKKKKSKEDTQFQDFFNFSEALRKLPPHRVLAINRGERAKKIKVRIERDSALIKQTVAELLVSVDHPFHSFLEKCANDALNRLIIPALDREIRRELTENAEQHALQVFERNLRMLLLQPPVHASSLLAIDPGYRSGCHVAIVDQYGHLRANHRFHIVGNQQKQADGKELLVKLIKQNKVDLIAIGNGTGCRATEQIISDIIKEHFAEGNLRFVIVNEAGTSVYSTSDVGREELAKCEPVVRSAVSIGRRLLDPLSELVKVNPANLGVGLYQHDVKAKHLGQALDEAVENCVNFVGVDVNTASPSLLRYISGLGQLTARRVVEYRQEKGPFKNRQQLKEVTGFGDATFVQSAGFLRIYGGDQLLDGSSIHPESYELVAKILEKIGFGVDDLPIRRTASVIPDPPPVDASGSAKSASGKSANQVDAEKPGSTDQTVDKVETESKAIADAASTDGSLEVSASDSTTAAAEVASPVSQAAPLEKESPDAKQAPRSSETAKPEPTDKPDDLTESTSASPPDSNSTAATPDSAVPDSAPESATSASGPDPSASESSAQQAKGEHVNENGESGARIDPAVVARNRELRDKLKSLNTAELAKEFEVGELLIKDVIQSLMRPGRDPRFDLPKPIFRRGIIKLEDLRPEMQLKAQVLNVVDFGVFVDIGLGESSLIHISQLSRKFVRDPYRFFSIGDILTVWVNSIDSDRRRVSLTAIRPESAKPVRGRGKPGQKDRGPRGSRRPERTQSKRRDTAARKERPKRKKTPPKPITKGMAEGKEAMRSFSDLAQFYKLRDDNEDES